MVISREEDNRTVFAHAEETIVSLLTTVKDPEIPAVNIVELGIVRSVSMENGSASIVITPTYSGCPAMQMIEQEIHRVLAEAGIQRVTVTTTFSPAWTTDWLKEDVKEKLRSEGIAPPMSAAISPLLQIALPAVACPLCGSPETKMQSEFGSTACKAYYFCAGCRQPFEYFKSF